ncbi:MAG: hydratase [Spirochaetaceae bacterium]|jgi:aconitate hydratase|nr:hydratase [Spirochaetaceae bacterium]
MLNPALELFDGPVILLQGREIVPGGSPRGQEIFRSGAAGAAAGAAAGGLRQGTITHGILASHHRGGEISGPGDPLHLHFDVLASHDITYVGIIQTARPSGLKSFPLPYILTNCHNSLCAVGGTINEDDHVFGLSAARKYGGVYVPPHLGVIHSYMREAWAGCGKMILGSDSHTRYGALGTLAVGEGGGELVKQLLRQSYDMAYPRIIALYLEGKPRPGVGPMDAALAIIGTVFKTGFVKNAVLEFTGPGLAGLSADYRNGIDVMTTETACWSSVWETDGVIRDYLALHGRAGDYRELKPGPLACYDGLIKVRLDKLKPMAALPFHPSNVYELDELLANPADIFREVELGAAETLGKADVSLGLLDKIDRRGRIRVDQGIIAGCAGGTFENICAAAEILEAGVHRSEAAEFRDFPLSVYPGSQPVYLEIARNGVLAKLVSAGAVVKTAFCGPCFGAGDVPANQGLSIRHTTRNFPSREGSRPGQGQIACVALMDARSIAATAAAGFLCSALGREERPLPYHYDDGPYRARVYNGIGRPEAEADLRYGPNITDWPPMEALGENLLLKIVSFISDPVTTTDELIPSGEASSYRSNPQALAEFTLSRKDPAYVGRSKALRDAAHSYAAHSYAAHPYAAHRNAAHREGAGGETRGVKDPGLEEALAELHGVFAAISGAGGPGPGAIQTASSIFAVRPGDGSAREQAASCQRVLGGGANFANDYATKRYRSNLINWGIIPFVIQGPPPFQKGDYIFIPGIRACIREASAVEGRIIRPRGPGDAGICGSCTLTLPDLSPLDRELLLAGSLINYNRRYNRLFLPGQE